MKRFLLVTAVLAWVASSAFAGSVCPSSSGPSGFSHPPDSAATGCNVVVTIAANGSVSTAVTDATPYENSEDVLVGVVNNSSTPVASLNLTGGAGNDIFGFDGDGMCTYVFTGNGYCTGSYYLTDPGDYAGPTSTFTNISGNGLAGTVNFSPAVAASGGTTYFSLEGIPTGGLTAVVGPSGPSAVPSPSSITLLIVGFAVLLLIQAKRKFARA